MIFVVVYRPKFKIRVMLCDLTELQFQVGKNSLIDDFPSVSGSDDNMVVAEVYRVARSLVFHSSSMACADAGSNCIPRPNGRGFVLRTKIATHSRWAHFPFRD